MTLPEPSCTVPWIYLSAVVKVNFNVPSLAVSLDSTTTGLPLDCTVIFTGWGGRYECVGGGPAIGPLGICGPMPTIQLPSAKLTVKFSESPAVLFKVICLTLKPVGEPAKISMGSSAGPPAILIVTLVPPVELLAMVKS